MVTITACSDEHPQPICSDVAAICKRNISTVWIVTALITK
ncbi:hypothetical protein BMETH_28721117651, partial [methanotrophic bacterial endosymbiont of Bathymodiolus sp.]